MSQSQETDVEPVTKARIWDIPVRAFHWLFAGCFVTAWVTLDDRYLDIHVFAGYLMGGLLLFRLLWGFIGGHFVRFRTFTFGWAEVRSHLTSIWHRHPLRYVGHNPAGSWAIFLMLGLCLLIVVTGILALGGEEQQGPVAGLLNYAQGNLAHEIHGWLSWLMLGIVAIHVLGVFAESLLLRENLVAAMLTGFKSSPAHTTQTPSHWKVGATMLLASIAAGLFWFQGYLTETPARPYQPFLGPALPDNPIWREECGACHLAFHPSLLPARSWKALMDGQASHFGEDLFLGPSAVEEIEAFLLKNAAEQASTEAAWKIDRSIPASETPLRITETAYWIDKHREISDTLWEHPRVKGRISCAACHLDAEAGTFEDAAMRLPDGVEAGPERK